MVIFKSDQHERSSHLVNMSGTHVDKLKNSLMRHYSNAAKTALEISRRRDEIGSHINPYQYDKAVALSRRFVAHTLDDGYIKRKNTVEKGFKADVFNH
ncbi:Piso0_000573 [Millerozyma farinosa CBS 7064]|uniref:Piso0_000573 protein n=1 Tax=Pichia sorbitophila (strain ATCC MYA-4447 / BCRC 22081 / CBS 7064 / NBRC 10061 / NRRL Y-12695) TaxID=559304 RepID=G8YVT2_PICSO|nr:Piso0_000573 [Millerozyma farinosa CBS 7064]CCE73526.1 Piso0_000573 [Millerozyma farinosa CBS 7064]